MSVEPPDLALLTALAAEKAFSLRVDNYMDPSSAAEVMPPEHAPSTCSCGERVMLRVARIEPDYQALGEDARRERLMALRALPAGTILHPGHGRDLLLSAALDDIAARKAATGDTA